jgi:hypothetical protein
MSVRSFLFLAFVLIPSAVEGAGYTVTTVQYPGSNQTYAMAANASGEVVGTYYDSGGIAHGFTLLKGTYTTVDTPHALATWLTGINDAGTMVGYSEAVKPGSFGFQISGRRLTRFSVASADQTIATGIDSAGVIVGYSLSGTAPAVASGFTYQNGTFTTVNFSGQANTWISSTNQEGSDLAGYAGAGLSQNTPVLAIILPMGGETTAFSYPGASQTFFNGINDSSVAVGYYIGSGASGTASGFIYRGGEYAPFNLAGAAYAIPQSITDKGVITGYYSPASNPNVVYGFIATP